MEAVTEPEIHRSVTNRSGVWWVLSELWWFMEVLPGPASVITVVCGDAGIGEGIEIYEVVHGRMEMC